ncbi:MAG: glycosyltransferase family 4 protein [Candidatus Moranbacteria bacterium]|nr:glycosyltransferase family 4 protein [Candidatus Moranbacteria bacterium]
MKIAFIGQKGIPALSGGVEKHVEKLSTRLAAQGHEVTVYVRSHYTPFPLLEFAGVRLVHVPSINTKHLDAITHTLLSTLHALFTSYDVIHFQSIGPSIFALIPRLLKPKTRVIATFHSRDYLHQKWNIFARIFLHAAEWMTCTIPEKTIVISETLQQYAEKQYEKVFPFVPNGAEVEYEADTEHLATWSLRPKRYVLSVSRLIRHKGLHYLIKAFNELEDTNKLPNNFKLVIVGGAVHTEEYVTFLHLLARGRKNIIFTGEQSGKVLQELFSHAAIFVQSSEDEGLSLALLEAMGHGVMPIVSDIPANREAVANTGAYFPSKDIDGLKRELAYFANRGDEVTALGKAAEERVREHYGWDAIATKTLEVYENVLQRGHVNEHYVPSRSK